MNILAFLIPKTKTKFVEDDATLRQTLERMDFYKYSVVPLLEKNGKYLGTIAEGDLLSYIKNECDLDLKKGENVKISSIPRYRSYKALRIDADFKEIVELLMEQNFIPLIDDRNTFIGIVPRKSILNYYYQKKKDKF